MRRLRVRVLGTEVLAVDLGSPPPPRTDPPAEETAPKGIHGGSSNGTTERAWSPQHSAVGFQA